jgi:hypothetical protein
MSIHLDLSCERTVAVNPLKRVGWLHVPLKDTATGTIETTVVAPVQRFTSTEHISGKGRAIESPEERESTWMIVSVWPSAYVVHKIYRFRLNLISMCVCLSCLYTSAWYSSNTGGTPSDSWPDHQSPAVLSHNSFLECYSKVGHGNFL